ncbi:MAG: Ig-like domain-containing protein [Kiritimatiellia bacterium]
MAELVVIEKGKNLLVVGICLAVSCFVPDAMAAPTALRESPADATVSLAPGTQRTFVVRGMDATGALHVTEWYLDGDYIESHPISGTNATDSWSYTFATPGSRTVVAIVYDTAWKHDSVRWDVVAYDSAPPVASRASPAGANVFVPPGATQAFTVCATDVNSDLRGVEWYVNGEHQASRFTLSGSEAQDVWSHTFPEAGTYTIEASVFDWQGAYSSPAARWTVTLQPRSRGMYVDKVHQILRNRGLALSVLEYAKRNSIAYLALYLGSYPMGADVDAFVQLAKSAYGVEEIGFIGGSAADFDAFQSYNSAYPGKADVFNLEYEFWNHQPRDFDPCKAILQHMRTAAAPSGAKVETYVGWPTDAEIGELAGLVDRLLLHCYVGNPANAYAYAKSRLHALGAATTNLVVWPIFSAESSDHYADQPFMGDWLAAHSLNEAEESFMAAYHDDTDPRTYAAGVPGFQYYSYDYMSPLLFLSATGLAPGHLAEGVDASTNLVITFNADISKGTTGSVTIQQASNHAVFESIPITDSRITVAGSQAIVDPAGVLASGVCYYVVFDATCFRSASGACHPGISVPAAWRFTTGAGAQTASGIPFGWLQLHDLPTDGSVDHQRLFGSSFTVWQHWRAGTDPHNRDTDLRITAPPIGQAQGHAIRWRSVPTRTYRIERSSDLAASPVFHPLQGASGLLGVEGTAEYVDETAIGPGPLFYRIVVE